MRILLETWSFHARFLQKKQVNERNYRRLYRETNGDYGLLAARLRVEGDRLTLPHVNPLGGNAGGPGAPVRDGAPNSVQKDGQHVGVSVGRDGQGGVRLK